MSKIHGKNLVSLAIVVLLCAQGLVWYGTHKMMPEPEIVPAVPTATQAKVAALGDTPFYFRYLALVLQNAGDSWGRFMALKSYDYSLLQKWFYLLDELDPKSHFVPSIAAYYYSNTQTPEDNIYIVNYLSDHYDKDPKGKWWWLGQAVHIANHKLKNKDLALKLAYKLSKTPTKVPSWARQMPAFILEQKEEFEEAYLFMKELKESVDKDEISEYELNFMNYFIKERLGVIEEEFEKRGINTTSHN